MLHHVSAAGLLPPPEDDSHWASRRAVLTAAMNQRPEYVGRAAQGDLNARLGVQDQWAATPADGQHQQQEVSAAMTTFHRGTEKPNHAHTYLLLPPAAAAPPPLLPRPADSFANAWLFCCPSNGRCWRCPTCTGGGCTHRQAGQHRGVPGRGRQPARSRPSAAHQRPARVTRGMHLWQF